MLGEDPAWEAALPEEPVVWAGCLAAIGLARRGKGTPRKLWCLPLRNSTEQELLNGSISPWVLVLKGTPKAPQPHTFSENLDTARSAGQEAAGLLR